MRFLDDVKVLKDKKEYNELGIYKGMVGTILEAEIRSGSFYVNFIDPNMIEDDIMGEKYAIYGYEKMLCRLKDGTLKALIVRIIEDEKLHLAELKRILEELSC